MIILLYTLRSYANTFIPQLVWLPGVRCYGPPSCSLVRLAPKCASLWVSSLYGLPSEGWGSLCAHVCRRPSADGAMYQYWSAFRPILVTARSNIGRVTEQYRSCYGAILLRAVTNIAFLRSFDCFVLQPSEKGGCFVACLSFSSHHLHP